MKTKENKKGEEREKYLQDSLIDKMVTPFLPITRPIFPGGTSSTERISSSGAWSIMIFSIKIGTGLVLN